MRALFLTTSYPSPFEPTKGTFNRALLVALSRAHEVRVVVPVPWPVAWGLASGDRFPSAAARAAAPPIGPPPVFPTYFYTPKVLRRWYGSFLWYSVRHMVRRAIQDFHPEVVIGYWAHPDGEVAVRAARMAGVPAVVMVGGSDVLLLTRDPQRRRLVVRALRAADAVLAVGADVRRRIGDLGVPLDKIHVFARGVDEKLFSPGTRADARARLGIPPGPMLLWVGRMVPVKGLDVLIEACLRLQRDHLDFRLYLVGDGPLRESLRTRVEKEGLQAQVRFAGPVPHEQLADWYRAADVTVLPSRSEGVPNVLRESLACGTPFVASRVGGVPELARHPELELVPPEDPDALASALARALRAYAGREAGPARRFDWADSVASLEAVLASVLRPPAETVAAGAAGPRPVRQWLRRALAIALPRRLFVASGPRRGQAVCLTFDDGPDPEQTPRLLDALRDLGVPATFFVIGERAARHPEIVRRMADEGHAVGHHSYRHERPDRDTLRGLSGEAVQTRALLKTLIGSDARLFRPPYGSVTAGALWRLWTSGHTVVLWSSDPRDYAAASADALAAYFEHQPLRGGDIVLLHDTHPHAAAALPKLVASARARGLSFGRVTDWIG